MIHLFETFGLFQTCHSLCCRERFPLPGTPSRLPKHSMALQLLSGIFGFVFILLCAFSVAAGVDQVSVGWNGVQLPVAS